MRWPLWITLALGGWMVGDLTVGRVPGWPEGIGVTAWLLSLLWAAASLRSQGFVAAVCRGAGVRAEVALTFDDGPDAASTPGVLATLAAFEAKATFFLIGEKVDAEADVVRQVVAAGHELGNHGARHRWVDLLVTWRAQHLITAGAQAILDVSGVAPRWFRPPNGVATPALGAAVRKLAVPVAGWSVRSLDTRGRASPQARAVELLGRVRAGDVILLHDAPERRGGRLPAGPALLATLLEGLAERGLKPVTLSQLMATDGDD